MFNYFIECHLSFCPIHAQLGYLLGDKPEHKDEERGGKQKGAHIGKAMEGKKGVQIINKSAGKKEKAYRQKYP